MGRYLRVMIDIDGPLVNSALLLVGGGSHRRKSAAGHVFDTVWLYRSPIQVGSRRVILLIQMVSTCLCGAHRGDRGGEGGLASYGYNGTGYMEILYCTLTVLYLGSSVRSDLYLGIVYLGWQLWVR